MTPSRAAIGLTFTLAAILALAACTPLAVVPTPAPPAAPTAEPPAPVSTVATAVPQAAATSEAPTIANPASQNCVAQGGKLAIEKRGDGGEIGVCYFEDNLQCEEWALMRGQCPVGGVKVTGYTTEAARYCAITGGTYTITGNSGQADEQGACTLPGGKQCDAADYYNGKCDASTEAATTPAATTGLTLAPPSPEICNGMAQSLTQALTQVSRRPSGVKVRQSQAPMTDSSTGASGTACRAMSTGTGLEYSSPDDVMKSIDAVMTSGGWTQDPQMAAGGPTGVGFGYRSGDMVCQALATWRPDASANCPTDQPISECKLTPAQKLYTITLDCAQTVGHGGAVMPNPAAQNCEKQGGSITIEQRGDGGQYGVCYFQDDQQCEEWALMRGECPVGGVKVTGYVTPAGRYCAITGGTYTVTANSGQADEQGTCTLSGGVQCDATEYYDGKCDAATGKMPNTSGLTLAPPVAEVCNGMAQALAEAVRRASTQHENIEVKQATEPVPMTDPSTKAEGTACRAQAAGTGEQFASPDAVMKEITGVLTSGGWTEDPQMAAGGPTGIGAGFHSADLTAMADAMWLPDPTANCPTDKPISACQLTPGQQLYTIIIDTAQIVKQAPLQGAQPAPAPASNPAATNCINVGGTPKTETRPDGGQYGVCYFGDNYVCEQWALMRGECPVGGVKVTGYNTPAARYCAITGGKYTVIGTTDTGQEAGSCTLPSGKVCDAGDYYSGACSSSSPAPAPPTAVPPIGMPNPASQYCASVGGTLRFEERGDGGQIGVCYFADNKQCEEWALEKGYCPVGGVGVTGYNTLAGRYCAISGGTYTVIGTTNTGAEAGTCALPDGRYCDAWSYYNGGC